MKYSKVPLHTFQYVQLNAGMLVKEFDPDTGVVGVQLGATGGGIEFDPHPTFKDRGEGIDNMPANTKQLKYVEYFEPHLTATFKTMTAELAKKVQPGSALSAGHITPSHSLQTNDFSDCWLLADYSDVNEDGGSGSNAKAGFVAIHLLNAMNVLGFRWKTNDKDKGDFAVDFQGHYDMNNIDQVPFEIYVVGGTAAA